MTLVLDMMDNDSGYIVNDIEGLDPVNATLVSSGYAGVDGREYQSAVREPRNIKIKLDLEPEGTETYTSLREKLNVYFMPKSRIKMRFYKTSGLYVDIEGFVEEAPAPLFQKEPKSSISVMCFKPDFIDPRMVQIPGVSVSDSTATPIEYPGNIEAGTVITLNVNRALPSFTVYNQAEDGILRQLDFSAPLVSGDQLVISSLQGNKGVTLIRSGVSSSLLYGKTAQSSWIDFMEGINNFRVYAPGDPIPYLLEYMVRYGGI